MKKFYGILLMCMMLFINLPIVGHASSQQSNVLTKPQREAYAKGEALVMLNEKDVSSYSGRSFGSAFAEVTIENTWDFSNTQDTGASGLKRSADDSGSTVLHVSSDTYSTDELVNMFSNLPNVEYAEPNYSCYATALSADTYGDYQWALQNTGQNDGSAGVDINVGAVWLAGFNSTNRVVAVIDSGINYKHEDIKNNMWINPYGKVLSGVYGYDFVNGDADPMDDAGHGTHCAGIIAAQGNNNTGISGINQSAKLMALKFLDEEGMGYLDGAIDAYYYIYKAQTLGVNVVAVNNSWGSEGSSNIFAGVMDKVGEKGAVSVCAAGNESINVDAEPDIPGCTDSKYVVNVAAVKENGDLSSFSNYGVENVDIAAPGTNILSTVTEDTFNPTIYQNKADLCAHFSDFTNTSTFSDDYKITNEKGNVTTEITSDNYFGLKNDDAKALKWNISNAKVNSEYHMYFPFVSSESNTPVYMSAMAKIASAPVSNNWWYYGCSVVLSYAELESDGTLPEDYDPEENMITWTGADGSQDYWSHIFGAAMENMSAGKDYALVLSVYVNKSGNYTIYLDDVAVSRENVEASAFGKYDFYSGTSMAAPVVTGAVALLSSVKPTYNAEHLSLEIKNMANTSSYLNGKVASGGMLDLTNYNVAKPYLSLAKVNTNGTVTLSGYSFGTAKGTVVANGTAIASANIQWKDKEITVPGSSLINKVVTFEVTNGSGTAKDTFYLVDGKKSFTNVADCTYMFDGGTLTTDGESLYYVDGEGELYQYMQNYWMPLEEMDLDKMFPKATTEELIYGEFYFDSELVYLDGSFYGIGVLDNGYTMDYSFIRYNLKKDKWVRVGNAPGDGEFSLLVHSTLAVYNGKLYLMGGLNTRTYEPGKAVRVYDPVKKTWSAGTGLPEARFSAIGRQVGDSLVLVLGGNSSGTSPKTLVYKNNTWTTGGAVANPLNYSAYLAPSDADNGILITDEEMETTGYFREIKYYHAPVGVISDGLIISGLPSDSLGDTYTYSLSGKSFKASEYQLTTKITGYDAAGVAVGSKFYVIYGNESDIYDMDDDYEDYGDYMTGYGAINLVSIPVKSGLFSVSAGTVKNGMISGIGNYLPGQNATLEAVPNKGYYFKKLTVDGKVISGNTTSVLMNKNVKATADFAAYKTKVTLNNTNVTLAPGKTRRLKATVKGSANGSKTVTWKSSNTKYATVNNSGKITIKKAGLGKTVTITATATDGSRAKATCKVSIWKRIKKITLSAKKTTLKAGKTLQIKAKFRPRTGILKTLTWTSGNTKYATVSTEGKVTAKKAGIGKKVTITAMATDGSKVKGRYVIEIKK